MFKWLTNLFVVGWVEATKHITTGGTPTDFVKGDGSLDGNTYAIDSNVIHTTGDETKSGILSLDDYTVKQHLDGFVINNPVSYKLNNPANGAIIIKHPIVSGPTFIEYYVSILDNTNQVLGNVEAQIYFTNNVPASSRGGAMITSNKTSFNPTVEAALDASGNFCLVIGADNQVFGFGTVVLEKVITSFTSGLLSAWKDGWTITQEIDTTAYTNRVNLQPQKIATEPWTKSYVQSGGYLTQLPPILTQAETNLFTYPNQFFRNGSGGIYPSYGAGMKIVYNEERANEIYFRGDQLDDGFYYRQSSGVGTWGAVHQVASRDWISSQGFLQSESDPVFTASPAFGITANDITNYNTSFGWGNHALAGYVHETRMLTSGDGINTIGDLSQDRNITLDFNYLDDRYTTGFKQKEAVRVATAVNITLSGLQTIGGVTLVAGDRVLVKSQTNAADNGIYEVSSSSWTRSTDFDTVTQGEVEQGASVFVEEGSILAKTGWTLATGGTIVLGTTPLEFIQYSGATNYAGGDNITIVGNEINHDAGSWVNKTALTAGNVISNLNVDQFGHITDWTTRDLDTRFEILSNKATGFGSSLINQTNYPTTKAVNDNFISTNPNSNNPSLASFGGDLNSPIGMNAFWFNSSAQNKPSFVGEGGLILNMRGISSATGGGFQIASGWDDDELGFKIFSSAGIPYSWKQFASREWVNSQGFLTSETDSQTLSLDGTNLSISNGNTVDLSAIDTDTTYTDGAGIGLSGTTFSVAAGTGLAQDADGLSLSAASIASLAKADSALQSEVDTLQTVTTRGNTTSQQIIIASDQSSNNGFKRTVNQTSGGWSRLLGQFENVGNTIDSPFNVGVFGNSTNYTYAYIGFGAYNSNNVFKIFPSGNVQVNGINNFLQLQATSGYAGIQFTHTAGTKYLQHSNDGKLIWGSDTLPANNDIVYHTGNLTSNTQLANGAGYITSASLPVVNDADVI